MNKKKDKELPVSSEVGEGKVNIVAQELKFAKLLACNDQKIRNGVLKSLKKWLATRSQSSYRKYKAFDDENQRSSENLRKNLKIFIVFKSFIKFKLNNPHFLYL